MHEETTGPRGTSAALFWSALAAVYALFAAIAWIVPPQGTDWLHLVTASEEEGPVALAVLARTRVTEDLVVPALALVPELHALLSPLVLVALFAGMVAHARGRWPDPRRAGDAFLLLAAPAALWLAAPSFGLVVSHRPHVAAYVYGLTATLWLLALVRFAAPPSPGVRALLYAVGAFALGLLGGASQRSVGTVGLVAFVLLVRTRRRAGEPLAAWTVAGALGLAAGAVAIWLDEPRADVGKLWVTRIDANLGILYEHVGQNGQIASVLAFVLLALVVRARLGGAPLPAFGVAQLEAVRGLLYVWVALALVGLVGPVHLAPVKLAPAVALSIAALSLVGTIFDEATGAAWLRRGLWLLLLVPLADVLLAGMPRWLDERDQHRERLRAIAAAPRGGIATVAPARPVAGDYWVAGESWWSAGLREATARSLFGLEDIEFSAPFRALEPSMRLDFGDARAPHDLLLAKERFRRAPRGALTVESLDWPERRGRPVLAARVDEDGEPEIPRAQHGGPVRNGRYWVRPHETPPPGAETFVVGAGRAWPFEARAGRLELAPPQVGWYFLVVCEATVCWAVDAFYVRP